MTWMPRLATVSLLCLVLAAAGCATAQGDLRILQHEKAHLAEQVATGVTAIYPASLVVGVVTGTEKTKLKVATGEYDRLIDQKMVSIKSECGL